MHVAAREVHRVHLVAVDQACATATALASLVELAESEPSGVPRTEVMVDLDLPFLLIDRPAAIVDSVELGALGDGWPREPRGLEIAENALVESTLGNLVVRELRPDERTRGVFSGLARIEDVPSRLAEVSAELGGGRHVIEHGPGRAETEDLRCSEEERPVADDRAADGASELVLSKRIDRVAIELACVQRIVLEEPECHAVVFVGARLGNHIHDAARAHPELCGIVVRLHLELGNRV